MTNKFSFFLYKTLIVASLSVCFASVAAVSAYAESVESDEEWVCMPEGGKPAFVGVQGGTVPATVFYSGDKKETTAQAGLGSNDFLEAVQGDQETLAAENLIPFGFAEEARSPGSNVAVIVPKVRPEVLPSGVTKIYEQDFTGEELRVNEELSRM